MKGRFKNSKAILATDRVPDSIFGYPVVSKDADYTEADVGFFREHPEAGGYYDLEDSEEQDAQAAEKAGRSYDPGESGERGYEPTWTDWGGIARPYRKVGSFRWDRESGENVPVVEYYGSSESRPLTEREYNKLWRLNTKRRKNPYSSLHYIKQSDGTYRHPEFGDMVIYQEDMEDLIAAEEERPSYNPFLGKDRPELYRVVSDYPAKGYKTYRHINGHSPSLSEKEYEKLVARHEARKNDPISYIHFVHDIYNGDYILPSTGARLSRDEYMELYKAQEGIVDEVRTPKRNREPKDMTFAGRKRKSDFPELFPTGDDWESRTKRDLLTFGLTSPEGREMWGNTLMAASVLPSGGSSMTAGAFLRGLATKQFAKKVAVDAGLSAGFQLITPEGRDNLVNDPLRFLGDTAVDTMKFAALRNGAIRGSLQAGAVDYVKSRLEGESSYDATMNGMKTSALFAALGGYGKLSSLPSSRLARYSMHAPVVGTMGYGLGVSNGLFGGGVQSYDGLTGTEPAPVVIPSYGSYNVNNNRVERVTLGR